MADSVEDPGRLAAVRATGLLDTEAEEAFDRLASLAGRLLKAPFAFMTVVDDERSFWKACAGVGDGTRQNTVQESFCQYVVRSGEPLVLPDARADERTRDNPSIQSMGVVAWAGYPVHTPDGHVLGTLCVVDTVVRHWTAEDVATLSDLAAIATREVALRVSVAGAESVARRAEEATARADRERARAQLLARIGDLLTAGLELEAIWAAMVRLAVPDLADYGFVYSLSADGSIQLRASGHRDPALHGRVERLMRAVGHRVGDAHGPGRVAVTGTTELLADIASVPELRPRQADAARELRSSSAITVPLRARGELIALLTVVRTVGSPPYAEDDVRLVEAIASRAALVLDTARSYDHERTLSLHLQRALLPPILPQPNHLQVASRYQPASKGQLVGGDWYDAYLDEEGTTSLVIGDVAGHDINAAATMGQLRTMLRTACHPGGSGPSAVLGTVDEATRALGTSVFATALLAQLERYDDALPARHRRLVWSSAGHLPPVLLTREGKVTLLDTTPDRALGLDLRHTHGAARRRDHETDVPPDATLLLYTDGLVERRRGDLDAGLRRLLDTVGELADRPLENFCDELLERMAPDGDDDVALLAVRMFGEDAPRPPGAGASGVPDEARRPVVGPGSDQGG